MCAECEQLKKYLAEAEAVIKNLLLADNEHELARQQAKANQMKVTIADLLKTSEPHA